MKIKTHRLNYEELSIIIDTLIRRVESFDKKIKEADKYDRVLLRQELKPLSKLHKKFMGFIGKIKIIEEFYE